MLISTYFYSPLPGMINADYAPFTTTNSKTIDSYLSLIPKTASVSASNNLGAHLSHRDHIYVVPFAMESAEYVVLYGENRKMLSLVNHLKYQALISDKKIIFIYISSNQLKSVRLVNLNSLKGYIL